MATKIRMRHPKTGIVKDGFLGFSWTTCLFGPAPVWLRGDFPLGFAGFLGPFVAFVINKWYTIRLVKEGYELAGTGIENELARMKLGLLASKD